MHSEEITMPARRAFARSLLLRLVLAAAVILCFTVMSRAGGPKLVAGTVYFDPTTSGQPLVWPQGLITYYTDQGDLSSILPNASANSLVASAFSPWTSVATAAIAATRGGQLAEDVNGSNVMVNADGSISVPTDIQPTAIGTPVGIVYDYDGSVTDALMGSGAGASSQCFFNAVFGGDDNYGTFASYQHALIVINGRCALQSSQLTDVEYRLVRVIGSVLGLGWSQLNPNVLTGAPHPTFRRLRRIPGDALHRSHELRAHHALLSQSLSAGNGRCRRPLATLPGHDAESVEFSRQTDFFNRHGTHSRFSMVHRFSR